MRLNQGSSGNPGHSPKLLLGSSPGRQQQQPLTSPSRRTPPQRTTPTRIAAVANVSADSSSSSSNNASSVSSSPRPDYVLQYTQISSKAKRDVYKEEFNTNYNKYRKLHSVINAVSKRFAALEAQLNQLEPGSHTWKVRLIIFIGDLNGFLKRIAFSFFFQRMKSKIMQEYAARQQDKTYVDNKKEFLYLHEKLSHIKGLVTQYDQNAISSSAN